MVHKQAANSMGSKSDGFADDDPLAELARIVGFDQPARREPQLDPSFDTAPSDAGFNLEDELMSGLGGYDEPVVHSYADAPFVAAPEPTPRSSMAPTWHGEAQREVPRFSPQPPIEQEPVPFFDRVSDAPYDQPEPEPANDALYSRAEPMDFEAAEASNFLRNDAYDFGRTEEPVSRYQPQAEFSRRPVEEVATGFGPTARDTDPTGSQALHAAYEPAGYSALPVDEPSRAIDLADEIEMAVSEPQVPTQQSEAPRLRLPLANFQVAARREEPTIAPAPAVEPQSFPAPGPVDFPVLQPVQQPVARQVAVKVEPPAFDWSQVTAGPVEPVPRIANQQPMLPVVAPRNEIKSDDDPVFSFDFAQQLAEAEELDHRPAAAVAPSRAEPVAKSRAFEPLDVDPFIDQEFELQLDELDIDLSDIEPAAIRPAPVPPMLAAPQNLSVSSAAVPRPFQQPDMRVAYAAPTPPPARQEPDFLAARIAPTPPTVTTPVQTSFPSLDAAYVAPGALRHEQDIGFDPAEIAEQDVLLETIAPMDVPEVPIAEKPPQMAASNDFDLDFDTELATLLDEPVAAQAQKPANRGMEAVAQAGDSARSAGPLDEFEAFEKALEDDFRTVMAPDAPAERPKRGHIQISGNGQGGYRKLKPYLMAGTAAVLLLAGVGGIYAWVGSGAVGSLGGGEPVVIAADKTPNKIVPEDPGGKTVPNQDKAVYDRVAGNGSDDPTQPNLISSEEEPMDVVQRTLIPETLPLEGENDFLGTPVGETEDPRLLPEGQQARATAEDDPATVTPRRVRTMIVRPDGTLVAQEAPAAPEPNPLQTATNTEVLAAPSVANENTGNTVSTVAARAVTPTAQAPQNTETALASAAATAADRAAAAIPTPSAIPSSRPAEQPVNIVGTVTSQGNLRPAQPATAPDIAPQQTAAVTASPSETGAAGGYGIQIASLPSQVDAERSYRTLTSRFSGILGGKPHEIRQADIPGKGTYYRVRILASSRDAAVALCEQYRSAGGSCLVSR